MSRALLVLANDAVRAKAVKWVTEAPKDTRITFQSPQRTTDQNSRLWASLSEVADQAEHLGRKYDAATWKAIFMSALGREMRFVPNLDGTGLIPIGHSSSDLSKSEMSDLLEVIYSWGSGHGVTFHDDTERAA
jgi:hypothetical protein